MPEIITSENSLTGKSSHTASLEDKYDPHVLRGAWLLLLARYSGADMIEVTYGGSSSAVQLDTNTDLETEVFLDQVIKRIVGDTFFTSNPVHSFPLAKNRLRDENSRFLTAFWHKNADNVDHDTYHIVVMTTENSVTISVDDTMSSDQYDATLPKRLVGQFQILATQLQVAGTHSTISMLNFMGPYDWEDADSHELSLPEAKQDTLHSMMTKNCLPGWQAIEAWDGTLTYAQLDSASNVVARRLQQAGVHHGSYVSLFFEKSMWHPVSVFACSKLGAPWVTIPPDMPLGRVKSVIDQLKDKSGQVSQVCLSSVEQSGRAASFIRTVIEVDTKVTAADSSGNHDSNGEIRVHNDAGTEGRDWLNVKPRDMAYVTFTSGTTGSPKGIPISQESMCSFIEAWVKLRGYPGGPEIRESHILSYMFDMSLLELLVCLCTGSCLCILSEDERVNDLGPALARYRVTNLHITPSLSEVLSPTELPDVKHIHLSGELMTQALVKSWLPSTQVLVTYGPAEITNECSGLNVLRSADFGNGCIGRPFGSRMYIVNPDHPQQRLPRGFVGEIIVEGPGVSAGYVMRSDETAIAFVENLAWAPVVPGSKPRRFYRTGDLGYVDADGLFFCRGRKDLQVKIHGHRIELTEVENQIMTSLPQAIHVVVEAVVPRTGTKTLVAFLQLDEASPAYEDVIGLAKTHLIAHLLPAFIPSVFILLDHIPLATSGKTDRKRLRAIAKDLPPEPPQVLKLTAEKLSDHHSEEVAAEINHTTISAKPRAHGLEQTLRGMWATVLHMKIDEIGPESHFVRLGGQSLAAMKLVSMAKNQSIPLSVAQIFQTPTLREMAATIASKSPTELNTTPGSIQKPRGPTVAFPTKPLQAMQANPAKSQSSPVSKLEDTTFQAPEALGTMHHGPTEVMTNGTRSMLNGSHYGHHTEAHNRNNIAVSWGIDPHSIEDVSEATPLQESKFRVSQFNNGEQVLQFEIKIPQKVSIQRIYDAWRRVVDRNSILRTRLFQSQSALLQVVLADDFHWTTSLEKDSADARRLLRQDMGNTAGHLCDLTLFSAPSEDNLTLIWTVHCALLDRYAAYLILNSVKKAYRGHVIPQNDSYMSFYSCFSSLRTAMAETVEEYWKATLQGCRNVAFPAVSDPYHRVCARANFSRTISKPVVFLSGVQPTTAAVLRGAWALTMANLTKTDDVVFGTAVDGRSDARTMNVVGPLLNTLPIRIKVNRALELSVFIDQVHQDMVAMMPFEQTSTSRIASISPELQHACQFQNILNIPTYPQETEDDDSGDFAWMKPINNSFPDPSQALVVSCFLSSNEIRLHAQYDDGIIKEEVVEDILAHFASMVRGVSSAAPETMVESLLAKENIANTTSTTITDSVETHIRRHLPITGECIVSDIRPTVKTGMLVAFLRFDEDMTESAFASQAAQIREQLEKDLPANMIPSAFYQMPKQLQLQYQSCISAKKTPESIFPEWVVAQLGVDASLVQEVTPTTPFQTEIIGGMVQVPGVGTFIRRYPLLPEMDVPRLRMGWDLMCAALPCMRTRVILSPEDKLPRLVTLSTWQTVDVNHFESPAAAEEYVNSLRVEAGSLCYPLARAAVVHVTGYPSMFIYAVSHSVYDRVSLDVAWEALCDAYWSGQVKQVLLPYSRLMNYLGTIDPAPARAFWSRYLEGARHTVFPTNPTPDYITRPAGSENLAIPLVRARGSAITTATMVRAAWGLTVGSFTGSTDVVFRSLLSGRTAAIDGIEHMCGPTITNVPIRVRADDQDMTVAAFLAQIQEDAANILEHETLGLFAIADLNPEIARICGTFNNSLVVHPASESATMSRPLPLGQESMIMDMTGYVAFVLTCSLDTNEVLANTIHDPVVIDNEAAQGVLVRFKEFLLALVAADEVPELILRELLSKSYIDAQSSQG